MKKTKIETILTYLILVFLIFISVVTFSFFWPLEEANAAILSTNFASTAEWKSPERVAIIKLQEEAAARERKAEAQRAERELEKERAKQVIEPAPVFVPVIVSFEDELLNLINTYRKEKGKIVFENDKALSKSASDKGKAMDNKSLLGKISKEFAPAEGSFALSGELIACSNKSAKEVLSYFKANKESNALILSDKYHEAGVGKHPFIGKDDKGTFLDCNAVVIRLVGVR